MDPNIDYSKFAFPNAEHFIRTPIFWMMWFWISGFIIGRMSKRK